MHKQTSKSKFFHIYIIEFLFTQKEIICRQISRAFKSKIDIKFLIKK